MEDMWDTHIRLFSAKEKSAVCGEGDWRGPEEEEEPEANFHQITEEKSYRQEEEEAKEKSAFISFISFRVFSNFYFLA